jgi:hypothetical protein
MEIIWNVPPALVIGMLVSTVLPVLVGLVTTRVTHSGIQAILLAGLAAATGLLTELGNAIAQGVAFDMGTGLALALGSFIVAVALHYGFWKPTTVTAKAQAVLVTPKVGPVPEDNGDVRG